MIFEKIWERYFLKEFTKVFFLFILAFFFLYVLIDYSTHSSLFSKGDISLLEVCLYYIFHFIKRAEVLLAFALLLASNKVLCSANTNNELVALLVGGVKLKTLLRPFFFLAALCVCFLYLNFEFISPKALSVLEEFKELHLSENGAFKQKESVHEVNLRDNTTMIYQKYDSTLRAFFDVYWILSSDQIMRIKYLFPYTKHPVGRFVDHLIRNTEGKFILFESFDEKIFSDMCFDEELLRVTLQPPDQQSLSQLWRSLPVEKKKLTDKEAQVLTTFYRKAGIPLVCFLVIIGPAPFCMRFNRRLRVFLIYSVSLFVLVTFFTIMDAASILGESQVFSPLFAVGMPLLCFYGIFSYFFWRLN